ncbi:MAG: hypothetical protein J6V24_05425 [Clostridia bacterium]|nr:hypothetical protein [Clostridia bacterium]
MKRLVLLLFSICCICLFASLAAGVSATEVLSYHESGYPDAAEFAPSGDGILLFGVTSRSWSAEGFITDARRTADVLDTEHGIMLTTLTATTLSLPETEDDGTVSVTFTIDLVRPAAEADPYAALGYGLYLDRAGEYRVRSVLTTESGDYAGETTADGSSLFAGSPEWNLVVLDTEKASGTLERLSVKIFFRASEAPARIMITAPYFTETVPTGLRSIEAYSTPGFTAEIGSFADRRGRGVTDDRGRLTLSGTYLSADPPTPSPDAWFEIRFGRYVPESGTLSVSVLYEGQRAEERRFSRAVSLSAGEKSVVIPVDASHPIESYTLQFENLERRQSVELASVRLVTGSPLSVESNAWIGTLSAIRRTGSSLHFEGTMTREAVRSFSGENLRFYALPAFASSLSEAVEIGAVKVSTRFETTVDLSPLPVSPDAYRFFAAIEGDAEGDLLPLDVPRCFDAEDPPASTVSPFGLYGALSVGAFEANVSQILVDVPLDRLLGGAGGVTVSYAVYGDEEEALPHSVSLDASLLAELDRDIPFYRSAGIRVWLRFTSASPIEGLTYGGAGYTNYAVDPTLPGARFEFAALVRFLTARYPDLEGIVAGVAANDRGSVGDADFTEPVLYAESLAVLCRIAYNAAYPNNPTLTVCVPLTDSDESDPDILGARSLAVMLARRIGETGDFPWALIRIAGESSSAASLLATTLDALSLPRPSAELALYTPDVSTVTEQYRAYAMDAADAGEAIITLKEYLINDFIAFTTGGSRLRAAFLSLDGFPYRSDHEFYDLFKRSAGTGGSVSDSKASNGPLPEGSSYVLWDFSDKHYALDWLPGGGSLSCGTAYSALFSEARGGYTRALYATPETTESGIAGIALCNLAVPADFTDVDAICFEYAVTAPEGTSPDVSLVFITGTDEQRAEFSADNVACGEIRRAVCDLRDWDGRADFVGVVIYAYSPVTLEIEEVRVMSSSLDDEGLAALFDPANTDVNRSSGDDVTVMLALFFLAAASVVVFILLSRHDREAESARTSPGKGIS